MKNNNSNLVPIQEVQYLQEEKIPTVEEIKNGAKLPEAYVQSLLNPQTQFESDLEVFTWLTLMIKCPAKNCNDPYPGSWSHGGCGGTVKWSEEAEIWCPKCEKKSFIKNWEFKCSNHADYRSTSGMSFTDAALAALTAENISKDFCMKVIGKIRENPWY